MNDLPKPRQPYVQQMRLDVLSQDRLSWAIACVHHLYPETKFSKALIIRRALAHYVNHLENVITPVSGGHKNGSAIQLEASHLLASKSDQSLEWPGGQFPEDQELLDKSGDIRPFRLLVKEAKDAVHKERMQKLYDSVKK